jgi:hypothetical protein
MLSPGLAGAEAKGIYTCWGRQPQAVNECHLMTKEALASYTHGSPKPEPSRLID